MDPDTGLLAEVVRCGVVESRHHGSLVALHPDGSVAFSTGDPGRAIFPRSSNKPLQSAGMARLGLDLEPELLALATASHSGEPFHLDGVRRILASAGLDESALQTPPDSPIGERARTDYVAAGGSPTSLAMNCSGKHAAMLATCVQRDWPLESYRDPDHPLQRSLRDTVEDLAGEPVSMTAVDGCGAPLWGLTLTGLARAFRSIALADEGTAEHRVAEAMHAHPGWLGGTGRDVSRFVEGVPGLIAKDGAEGVYAAALADGRAVAFKIADGAQRPRAPVMVAALRRLGVDAAVLGDLAVVPVLGGGRRVGEVIAAGEPGSPATAE